ncbi:hypothetical protein [Saccharibacillus qingshengii]|uniref:hypothetical protein n=1 Tax=Saccharibacillus qingshengii TaxID=1763540 RepID=UPI0015518F87|nr:hypothetical protein [Saccharibacillus qingshengii]
MSRTIGKALAVASGDTVFLYPWILLLSLYLFELSPYAAAAICFLSLACGAAAGRHLPRQTAYLAAMAVPAAASVLFAVFAGLGLRTVPLLILLGAAGGRGVYREIGAAAGRRQTLIFVCGLLAGVAVYAAALRTELMQPYAFSVYAACTGMLLTQLLRWNAGRVREAMGLSQEAEIPPGRLLRINRGFMTVLLLAILLVGGATQLSVVLEWLYRLWLTLLYGGVDLDYVPETSPPPPEPAPFSEPYVPEEKLEDDGEGGLDRWIIYAVAGIIVAAVGAFAFVLLRLGYEILSKWLPDWLKRLLQNLRIAAKSSDPSEEAAYADTTEKLESKAPARKKGSPQTSTEPPEGARREYARLIRGAISRGYRFRPWLTPSETGKEIAGSSVYREQEAEQIEELVERYNQTRYTQKEDGQR